jgi:hypothetical protein
VKVDRHLNLTLDGSLVILTEIEDSTNLVKIPLDDLIGVMEEFFLFASQQPET